MTGFNAQIEFGSSLDFTYKPPPTGYNKYNYFKNDSVLRRKNMNTYVIKSNVSNENIKIFVKVIYHFTATAAGKQ